MAATYRGSAIVVDGASTTIPGPVQIEMIENNATTSASITRSGTVVWTGGAGGSTAPEIVPFRSAGPIVVAVVGGGSITLYLRTSSNR